MAHYKRPVIKSRLFIKLASIFAFSGVALVMLTTVLNLMAHLSASIRTIMFVVGFTMMLLGTLWKVVFEMNKED